MKILNCTTMFYSPSYTFIINLIDKTIEDGHDVKIFTQNLISEPKQYDVYDLSVSSLALPKRLVKKVYNKLSNRHKNTDFALAKNVLEEFQPDIAHCHFGPSATYFQNIQDVTNSAVPTVISLHGYDVFLYRNLSKNYKGDLVKLSQKPYSLFTVPSNYLKTLAINNLGIAPEKIVVLHNSFNESLFTPNYKNLDKNETLKIVNVSRFVHWKGQRFLIEAANQLVANGFTDFEIDFIGDGDELMQCKQLADSYNLTAKCRFHGAIPHSQVADIVGNSHLYVHTAITAENGQSETFGIAILEAIAMGKPSIFFDSGGILEVFGDISSDYYTAVEEQNSQKLAHQILQTLPKLQKLDEEVLSKVGKAITEKYSEQKYMKNAYAIYQQLLSNR